MLYTIDNIFTDEQKNNIQRLLTNLQWYDGKKTAAGNAVKGKYSLQCDTSNGGALFSEFASNINSILHNNEKFSRHFANGLPFMIHNIRVNRYDEGMKYDWHVDSPYTKSNGQPVISNYGFVIMIANEFEGGDFELELPNFIDGKKHIKKWKGNVGDMIIFSTHCQHRVKEIISGSRMVVNGWISHSIQNDNDLQLLIKLNNIINYVEENIENEDKQTTIVADLTQIKAELISRLKTIK